MLRLVLTNSWEIGAPGSRTQSHPQLTSWVQGQTGLHELLSQNKNILLLGMVTPVCKLSIWEAEAGRFYKLASLGLWTPGSPLLLDSLRDYLYGGFLLLDSVITFNVLCCLAELNWLRASISLGDPTWKNKHIRILLSLVLWDSDSADTVSGVSSICKEYFYTFLFLFFYLKVSLIVDAGYTNWNKALVWLLFELVLLSLSHEASNLLCSQD